MYLHPDLETMSRLDLEALQLERLRRTVALAATTPFYRQRLAAAGIEPERIRTLADLRNIPLTTKEDLRKSYPKGMLAAPEEDVVRMHASSGTTGKPTVIFHTAHDLDAWTGLVARSLYAAGMRRHDVFQNMMTYGLFTGGLGLHYGAERVGMLVIPASSGNSKRQVQLIQDFSTTAVHITPSYALHLAQEVTQFGVADPRDLGLKFAVMGAEPYSIGTARKIEAAFGVKVFNCYGLSEMNGPAVAFECAERGGLHLWEDNFILEILDPETLQPLPPGTEGELVLTTINRTGMPILRYRTRDLTRILPEPCPCGRIHRRIERILGRTDDMLIISGVNVFPSQVEHVLMELPEVGSTYLIVLTKEDSLDRMTVKVELRDPAFTGNLAELHALQKRIEQELKSALLVTCRVKLVEPGDIPPSQGKAVRVVDERGGN
jgi:phenylacetate-CoA ligase